MKKLLITMLLVSSCRSDMNENVSSTTEFDSSTSSFETDETTTLEDVSVKNKRIFITERSFSIPEIKSLQNADSLCQSSADEKELKGNWKAILSSSEESFKNRIDFDDNTKYYLVDDKTLIAESWEDLLDGTIVTPIFMTERMQITKNTLVWTGSLPNGSYAMAQGSCGDWTEYDTKGQSAAFGNASRSDLAWISFGIAWECDSRMSLYCIEL